MEDFAVYSDEISTRYARSLFRRRGLHPYEDANGKFLARLLRVEQDGRFVLEDEHVVVELVNARSTESGSIGGTYIEVA